MIPLGGTDYWVVRNDTPQYNGTIPISTATTLSDNTVYAQLTMRVWTRGRAQGGARDGHHEPG